MKGWKKVTIAVLAVGGGLGVGYALYKRSVNMALFAEFHKQGDINGDGVIDSKDQALLQAAWQSTPTSSNWNPDADLNDDGYIDATDAAILGANWGLTYQQWLKTKGYAKKYTVQTTNVPIKEI
jgi:hypothetical protein